MNDILSDLQQWIDQDQRVALATVVSTWGSSPRAVGAKMAMTPGGKITGSVSGGCVEGAVYEAGVQSLQTGAAELLHFGVSDESAFEVGLACGGTIEVFVQPLNSAVFELVRDELAAGRSLALVTLIRGAQDQLGSLLVYGEGGELYSTLDSGLAGEARNLAQRHLSTGESGISGLSEPERELTFFVDIMLPQPVLIMVGGAHIAIALAELARTTGYSTVVVDPRKVFGSPERFLHVDRLIQAWPDQAFLEITLTQNTAVAMLTHDPKIDDPAIKIVLSSPVFYIGALGSRKTQENRRQRLLDAGIPPEQIARIHGPIGLDIGGKTPEETALAIMAEIVAVRRGSRT